VEHCEHVAVILIRRARAGREDPFGMSDCRKPFLRSLSDSIAVSLLRCAHGIENVRIRWFASAKRLYLSHDCPDHRDVIRVLDESARSETLLHIVECRIGHSAVDHLAYERR
jgi:hypothetical protein